MKIVEAPRDAMQSVSDFIPTADKIRYINSLLRVGFDTLDIGAFVSHNAIPQLADTAEVIRKVALSGSTTKLQVLVGNERGATEASEYEQISYISFPFTFSPTFAKLNTNANIQELFSRLAKIQEISSGKNKELIAYISMAFGNPYGDTWNVETLAEWLFRIEQIGVTKIHLANTNAESDPALIKLLFSNLIPAFPQIEIGLHLHTEPHTYIDKVHAAYTNGCKRFDSVLNGIGGHPVSQKEHITNLRTGSLISYLEKQGEHLDINRMAFLDATQISRAIFPRVEIKL